MTDESPLPERIAAWISESGSTFDGRALATAFGLDFDSRDFRLTLWAAKEAARERFGIVFVPGPNGTFTIAEELQKHRRAKRFARTAVRKMKRSADIASLVDETKVDPEHRDAVTRSRERLAALAGRMSLRSAEKPDPKESTRPALPRGR